MKIYITGVSGTGKTSIARALKAKGINATDIDELSHWENKETKETVGWEPGVSDEWNSKHVWLCDVKRLREIISSTKNAVSLGHASNQDDYLPFFDKIFVLRCSEETIIHRISTRTDNDFGKHPDDMKRILEWNKSFEKWMVDKGADVIDTERSLDNITKEITSYFD